MANPYRAIQWTKQKFLFDLALLSGAGLYLTLFVAISWSMVERPDAMEVGTILVRAFSTLAVLLLHGVLAIGPLSRLNPAFLPLIQHRRHLGVVTFAAAMTHGGLAVALHHGGGVLNPLAGILIANGQWLFPREWPFEVFGLAALLILAVLAATSHDFWLAYLSPEGWKRLHLLVYAAYVLVVLHAALGVIQEAGNPAYALAIFAGMAGLLVLHRRAAAKEQAVDARRPDVDDEGYVRVCPPNDIPMGQARVVMAGTERIAVFRYWQGISALSNVCAHQGGPLGEGGMAAGCVRCPWHGSIYFPQSGLAPAPSNLAVPTFPVKLVEGCIYVSPVPYPLGTETVSLPVPGQKGRAPAAAGHLVFERGVVSSQRTPRTKQPPSESPLKSPESPLKSPESPLKPSGSPLKGDG